MVLLLWVFLTCTFSPRRDERGGFGVLERPLILPWRTEATWEGFGQGSMGKNEGPYEG